LAQRLATCLEPFGFGSDGNLGSGPRRVLSLLLGGPVNRRKNYVV